MGNCLGASIAPDEFIQPELSMDYDGKRDRWAGYDAAEHRAIIEEYQKIEDAKRQLRAEKLNSDVDGDVEVLNFIILLDCFPRLFKLLISIFKITFTNNIYQAWIFNG